MAFDLYVGGFARFYSLQWENVVEANAKETGAEYKVITPDGSKVQAADRDQVEAAAHEWMRAVNDSMQGHIDTHIHWDESDNAPYFTDRVDYDAYGALLVWASHSEQRSTAPTNFNQQWWEDVSYKMSAVPTDSSKYAPLISAGMWLPADIGFMFEGINLYGDEMRIASIPALLTSLDELNKNTFQMDEAAMEAAFHLAADDAMKLEPLARLGFALFYNLGCAAYENNLPMLMST